MIVGNIWFKRFYKEATQMSTRISFRRIKFGFYRIYWDNAYIGECYDNMPPKGYDIVEDDVRYMNQSYYEQYEDSAKMTRQIKNFVEGYYDSIKTLRTRVYMLKNDQEYRKTSANAYKQFYVK